MPDVKLAHFKGIELPKFEELPDKSFGQLILEELVKNPDHTLFVDLPSGREVTNGEIYRDSVALGNALWKMGYKRGDCSCVCSYNLPECPVAFYGSDAVGMTTMWCNALYSSFEMNHQLTDSNSSLLLIPGDRTFVDKSVKAVEGTKVSRIILLTQPDFDLTEVVESSGIEFLLLKDLFDVSPDNQSVVPYFERDFENDIATLLYSSGTTGLSKGVMLTQSTIRYFLQRYKLFNVLKNLQGDDTKSIVFLVPPIFHIYGLMLAGLFMPYTDGKVVMQRRFSYKGMLEAIPKYQVKTLSLVPAILTSLVKDPNVDSEKLKTLKTVVSGAASLSKDTMKAFYDLFGENKPPIIMQGYGMTEGGVSMTPPTATKEDILSGTVGMVEPGNEAKVVDLETFETVPVNVEGEIWSRPKTIMKGYLNRPEETAKTITEDGWLRTGDIGYFREDGYLFVTDRLKELVKYKGYQVPPAELEAVLLLHPDVVDAGVTGKPDEEAGQLPIAFVTLKAGVEASPEKASEITLFVKEKVAPYKQLKGGVHFVPEVPRNAGGKIIRRKLISTFLKE